MKKEIRDAWIAALESGKYKQGRSALKTGADTYCCLGVLACVMRDNNWLPEGAMVYEFPESLSIDWQSPFYGKRDSTGTTFPGGLRDHIGITKERLYLDEVRPNVPGQHKLDLISKAMDMNDSGKHSFAEIAEFLRQHPTID